FSVLDHRFHFGPVPRLAALLIMVAGIGYAVYLLGRALTRHFSTHHAANYIEGHRSYDQQLVTAVEYYENREDYPYSRALAERLVEQVDTATQGVDFTETVPKWQAYLSAAVIAAGLVAVAAAVLVNGAYFARYYARLTQPFTEIAPMPLTSLESLTGDVLTPPEVNVSFAAKIEGRVPEQGALRIETAPKGPEAGPVFRELLLTPDTSGEGGSRFTAMASFPLGDYRYRFESGDAATEWHAIAVASVPTIMGITAEIAAAGGAEAVSTQVREFSLDVLKGATVTLKVETSEPVREVAITTVGGEEERVTPGDTAGFQHRFTADEAGLMRFRLTSTRGITNEKAPPLLVSLREDAPPQFKLVTPAGDYLATNVASIPIAVEVSDDFGLGTAELVIEIPRRDAIRVPAKLDRGIRHAVLAHTIDLEDYDLQLGDSILFHAEATDVPTGMKDQGETGVGDVYFIEIKPYRQVWHQLSTGMPSDFGKQGLGEMKQMHASLVAVLEYSRAILKKTWPLAGKAGLDKIERGQVASILKDVQHTNKQIGLIQEDPRYRFAASQLAALDDVRRDYDGAAAHLERVNPAEAVVPEKAAYQKLRAFVKELEKAMGGSGGGGPEQGPERLKMEEQVHLTRFEKEQKEWELKRLENTLEKIREEQRQLQDQFDRFMKEYGKQEGKGQQTADERSWQDPNAKPPDSSEQQGGGGESSRTSLEGALEPSKGGGAGSTSTIQDQQKASPQDRLEMMRARETALREQVEQLAQNLESQGSDAQGIAQAQQHLQEAMAQMDAFDQAASDAFYTGSQEAMERAGAALGETVRQLNVALFALQQAASLSAQERASREMVAQANAMAQLALALDNVTDPAKRQGLLAQLEQAGQQFMEQGGPDYVGHFGGAGSPPNYTSLTRSLVPEADKSGLDINWTDLSPERQARYLAEQYWTRALDVRKQAGDLRGEDPSDPAYIQLEKDFFEQTAQFEPGARP
ncbi:MAG: hypothetical protein IT364_10800, partial [Candidatus Hydrogenedentes bacterium]|nr:hypothetical protein [Candidatus Hydrogenedentota bacterium]